MTTVVNVCDQALVRAGVQVKGEKEMDKMENTGKLQCAHLFGDLVSMLKFSLQLSDPSHKQAQTSATASSCESADDDRTYTEVCDPGQGQSTTTTTVGEVLSVTQLVLRRGLTLLVMVVLLIAGVLVSDFLTVLLK